MGLRSLRSFDQWQEKTPEALSNQWRVGMFLMNNRWAARHIDNLEQRCFFVNVCNTWVWQESFGVPESCKFSLEFSCILHVHVMENYPTYMVYLYKGVFQLQPTVDIGIRICNTSCPIFERV